jgi:hypothetical protein
MRMLMSVEIPNDKFNAAIKDGSAGQKIAKILESNKPEATYFTEQNGRRGAILVVEVADPSKVPALAEPWFITFNAEVKFRIAMTPDDLRRSGLDEMAKKWG